jgi:uncharacterized membrane protein YdjX (TVP38/TMEM64 family)
MSYGRIVLLLVIAAAIAAFFLLNLGQYLTLDSLKGRQAELAALVEARPLLAIGGFFLVYVAVTALSLPGAAIMTLAAGAIFGLLLGTIIVSFASAMGASLAFLSSRYVLRGWVQSRFGKRVKSIDEGIEKDGAFYLLTLRLIPAFPFFLINLAMGLTRMRLPYLLRRQPDRHAAGHARLRECGDAACRHREYVRHPLAGADRLVRPARPVPAYRQVRACAIRRRRIYKGYKRPSGSTATWS